MDGASFVTDTRVAEEILEAPPPIGDGWRVKRAFGMTGRGHRVIAAASGISDADRAFLRASMDLGGVQIEPNVVVVTEYAIHGMLGADRSLVLGDVVVQRCDARGSWIATEPLDDPPADVAAGLDAQARLVSGALGDAGYFGPFGIDAFTYRDAGGGERFRPRSEVNARYTMGFAVGFRRARARP